MILKQEHFLNQSYLDTILIELNTGFHEINYAVTWKPKKKFIHPKLKAIPLENRFDFKGHILNKYFPFIRKKVSFGALYFSTEKNNVFIQAKRPRLGFPYVGNYLAGEEKIDLLVKKISNQYKL